jgi:hypothetical protein
MIAFLVWLEATALSTGLRESVSVFAFPMILAYHTIGLGFLVGLSAALDLRLLGAAPKVPISALKSFFPVAWAGFWVNAASGLLLLIAYPTKALTNPLFYLKLLLIVAAVALLRRITATAFRSPDFDQAAIPSGIKRMAVASLVCWIAIIFAGRFLAYTHNYLTAYELEMF